MIRIDSYPTHELNGIKFRIGKALPFGATIVPGGVNFSIYSKHATACELLLFHKREREPYAVIPLPQEFRIGDVYSIIVFDIDYVEVEYGYQMDGKFEPDSGYWFNKEKILLDPYAKSVSGRAVWGEEPDWDDTFQYRGRIAYDDFDWNGDKQLEYNMEDLIIYETHVRGFTKHSSSQVKYGGTFAGVIEKIPYLKELGINCIEFLPIYEFDEFENYREIDGRKLYNYWGYSPVCFFAPKTGYAATGKYGMEVDELKNLVRVLHENGIEIILDVVFNHTAEGNEQGPYISYRGIDNKTYYLLTPEGEYYNFSGCGNTLNCNNSIVRTSILDCLRYWVSEYHIDGFRFDLASILARDANGESMTSPPLLEVLAGDAILSKTKLIAEAWDAGGMYQVGSFPSWGKWAEWNGKYRDTIRYFLKGYVSAANEIVDRISGSPDMYNNRSANASINFITCHDGFTLMDLVSYNEKHNFDNGENNQDGSNDNVSWNCGYEGKTENSNILQLRMQQVKNAATILLISRGVPMLLAGDEFGNSQCGNNNAYCQDNEISWLDWDDLKRNKDLFYYFKKIIALRKTHPVIRNHTFDTDFNGTGYPELSWHGINAWERDGGFDNLVMGVMYAEDKIKYGMDQDYFIYVGLNMHWEAHHMQLPILPEGKSWHLFADTTVLEQDEIMDETKLKKVENEKEILLKARSIVITIGKNV
ncbi:MAG: glycogen debranching protein GlgX, partial [Lachnospiraceae bacterium]